MKKLRLIFFAFTISAAYGQNEFAATAFYEEFSKLHADAQAGFVNYKGAKKNNTLADLADEYYLKHLLPLADSGKIVIPEQGNPFAEFYFQPGKTIAEANKRVVNLREAILTAFGKPLYTRTETSTQKQYSFSNTLYFTDANETSSLFAVFRSSVFKDRDKYYIIFQVIGKKM